MIESTSNYRVKFSNFLEVPLHELEPLFDGDSIDLLSLMGKFSNDMGVGDKPWVRVLAYILVHLYCFNGDFGVPLSGNPNLIDVVM